jgi:hypothetical protein
VSAETASGTVDGGLDVSPSGFRAEHMLRSALLAMVERWTLVSAELDLVAGKHGETRLGFALFLRF